MAGRYIGWHHKKSSSQASSEDLAAARKVLGALENRLSLGGVKSGAQRVVLDNGTEIVATLANGVPSVVINPARGGKRFIPARELGEFIVAPRSAAFPGGVDADYPEVMLRNAPDFWRSYFYGSSPAGFTGSGGSYTDMFPFGLGQGGTSDWVGPDGERLTWYGPSSRAFADAYVNARFQHGKKVFYLGEVLLDTDEYLAKSPEDPGFPERYIAGAALRNVDGTWWLYTMQYGGADGETPTGIVGTSTLKEFYSYPLAAQAAVGGLHRYRLFKSTDTFGVVRFTIVTNSREKLRTIATGSPDPWFFNRECTQAVCHLALSTTNTPGKPWWASRSPVRDNPPDPTDTAVDEYHPPATSSIVWTLSIGADGTSTSNVTTTPSVVSGGAAAAVTADYDFTTGVLNTYSIRLSAGLVPYFVFDGIEALLYQSALSEGTGTGGGDVITGERRWILYANPRDHVVVLLRMEIQFDTGATPQLQYQRHTVELYQDGVLVHSEQVTDTGDALSGLVTRWSDSTDYLDDLTGRSITPQWFIFGLMVVYSDTPGAGSDTWSSAGFFIGANPMFAQLPYPAECWFGIADSNIALGDPAQTVSEYSSAGFNGNVPDDNGYYAVAGAARHNDVVLVSTWVPKAGMGTSYSYVTGASLETLTSIGGAGARYHPVRLLGKMPVESREEDTE